MSGGLAPSGRSRGLCRLGGSGAVLAKGVLATGNFRGFLPFSSCTPDAALVPRVGAAGVMSLRSSWPISANACSIVGLVEVDACVVMVACRKVALGCDRAGSGGGATCLSRAGWGGDSCIGGLPGGAFVGLDNAAVAVRWHLVQQRPS